MEGCASASSGARSRRRAVSTDVIADGTGIVEILTEQD
jgi:hypothetical protein